MSDTPQPPESIIADACREVRYRETPLYSAPSAYSASSGILRKGAQLILVRDDHPYYAYVRLTGGPEGYVYKPALKVCTPKATPTEQATVTLGVADVQEPAPVVTQEQPDSSLPVSQEQAQFAPPITQEQSESLSPITETFSQVGETTGEG